MVESDFLFRQGLPVEVGKAGDNDTVFAKGEPVLDNGISNFVFESGVGLGGQELSLDVSTADEVIWATDDDGEEVHFEEGDYKIFAEGDGWSHFGGSISLSDRICDVEDPQTLDFYAPCQRVEPRSNDYDESRAMLYDLDGDGTLEVMFGPSLVFKGAANYNDYLGRDSVSQTRVFEDKDFDDRSVGTITLTERSRIGSYNMDEEGTYSDNSADVTYTITPA